MFCGLRSRCTTWTACAAAPGPAAGGPVAATKHLPPDEVRKSGAGIQTNGQKQPRHGLELVNPAPEHGSIGLEKYKMAAPGDGADQMGGAGMI